MRELADDFRNRPLEKIRDRLWNAITGDVKCASDKLSLKEECNTDTVVEAQAKTKPTLIRMNNVRASGKRMRKEKYLNAQVRKQFDPGMWFEGKVTQCWKSKGMQLFHIKYEDDDEEDIALEELLTILQSSVAPADQSSVAGQSSVADAQNYSAAASLRLSPQVRLHLVFPCSPLLAEALSLPLFNMAPLQNITHALYHTHK